MERTKKFYRVELRDRGQWGVEAQIFDPVDFVIGQRFMEVQDGDRTIRARESAVEWAKDRRAFIETGRRERIARSRSRSRDWISSRASRCHS